MSKNGALKRFLPWEVTLKEDHPRSKYKTGTVWKTKEWGDIIIIGQCDIPYISPVDGRKRYMWYLVEFQDGTQVVAERPHIASGKVRNPNQPTLYGRGYSGQGIYNAETAREEQSLWCSIFYRCYDEKHHAIHPTYKDATVCKRWYNFQNFCKDIKQLEKYSLWKDTTGTNQYHLDKDLKVKGNKMYGPDTCMFVTTKENTTEAGLTGNIYIGSRLSDGYEEEFINMSEFCRVRGWKPSSSKSITEVCRGNRRTVHGWSFRIKEEMNA